MLLDYEINSLTRWWLTGVNPPSEARYLLRNSIDVLKYLVDFSFWCQCYIIVFHTVWLIIDVRFNKKGVLKLLDPHFTGLRPSRLVKSKVLDQRVVLQRLTYWMKCFAIDHSLLNGDIGVSPSLSLNFSILPADSWRVTPLTLLCFTIICWISSSCTVGS